MICDVSPDEVSRWVNMCMTKVLTGEGKECYRAACLLMVVAKTGEVTRDMFSTEQALLMIMTQQQIFEWLSADVQENCAQALEAFKEAYPNGYDALPSEPSEGR